MSAPADVLETEILQTLLLENGETELAAEESAPVGKLGVAGPFGPPTTGSYIRLTGGGTVKIRDA